MNKPSDTSIQTSLSDWIRSYHSRHAASAASGSAVIDVRLSVTAMSSTGDPLVMGRLTDLGISIGEEVSYFGRAPLGEPIFICVRDTVIALRPTEAELFSVSESAT